MVENYARRRKENIPLQRYLIIVIFVSCIAKIWLTPQTAEAFWINRFFSFLYMTEYIYKPITSILFFVNVFYLNLLLRRFLLVTKRNYYVSFLYMLLCFVYPENLTLYGVAIGSVFIGSLFPMLLAMDETNAKAWTFPYGVLCGFLSMVYFPLLLMLVLIYVMLVRGKLWGFRLFVFPVFGASLIYIYMYSGFYLLDKADMMHEFHTMIQSQSRLVLPDLSVFVYGDVISLCLFWITVLWGAYAFLKLLIKSNHEIIYKRKKYYLFFIFMLIHIVCLLFFHTPYYLYGQIAFILFAIIQCMTMTYLRRKIWYLIVFGVLFAISFYKNFLILC